MSYKIILIGRNDIGFIALEGSMALIEPNT
jgi:hypothetical protein